MDLFKYFQDGSQIREYFQNLSRKLKKKNKIKKKIFSELQGFFGSYKAHT